MPPEKQNQQPWYKRHPLLAGAGTLALGGGAAFLGDKLLNGGKLTSQLIGSTQTAAEAPKVIPQVAPVQPSTPPANPEWLTEANNKWQAGNAIMGYKGTLAPEAYEGGAVNSAITGAADTAMKGVLGVSGLHDVTSWLGKAPMPGLSKAVGLARGVGSVAAPILDAQTWSEQPDLTQANAEFYGLSPERTKGYMGMAGATAGSLINRFPGGAYVDALVRTFPRALNDYIRRSATDVEGSRLQGEVGGAMFNRLIHAVKDGDTQTINLIKQNFPHLGDQFNEGSKMRDTIAQAYAPKQ